MKYNAKQISEMKEYRNAASRKLYNNLGRGSRIDKAVDGAIRAFRVEFESDMINMGVEMADAQYNEKMGKEIPDDGYSVKEASDRMRMNKSDYVASLVGIYNEVKTTKESHGRMYAFFHPFKAAHERDALSLLQNEFRRMNISPKQLEGYKDLTEESAPVPQEATIDKDGLSIRIDDLTEKEKSQIDLSDELKEPSQEMEKFDDVPVVNDDLTISNSK